MFVAVLIDLNNETTSDEIADYTHNWFFIDQLQAFEVWLKYGVEQRQPPQQLPVVLQVLLSQVSGFECCEVVKERFTMKMARMVLKLR